MRWEGINIRFLHIHLLVQESAKNAVEIAKKLFPDVECKWGDAGLEEIIQDASIIGVAVVLAGQIQENSFPSLFVF